MARYKISNPVIKKVEAGKQNAGVEYMTCTLKNTRCIWEEGQTYVCFLPEIVAVFKQILPLNKGGLAQQEQPIPAELSELQGCWVDWKPAQMFYKRHLSDHPAQPATATRAARPAIKAGQLVGEQGNPTVFTTLRVFCIYYIDEDTGEKIWAKGNSPVEVGQRAFANYCVPVMQNNQPQQTEPEIVNGVDYTNQQPQTQQQQGQFPFNPQGPLPAAF